MEKLKLPIEKHPLPFKVAWVQKGSEVPVIQGAWCSSELINDYKDEVWYNIVPMDVYHILLGRPWLYDRNMKHLSTPNAYTFQKDGKTFILHPLKEEPAS